MPCSALANLILFEKLLEEKKNFKEEVCNAFFVAATRAVFTRSMCTEVFSTGVTDTVVIVVGMLSYVKIFFEPFIADCAN